MSTTCQHYKVSMVFHYHMSSGTRRLLTQTKITKASMNKRFILLHSMDRCFKPTRGKCINCSRVSCNQSWRNSASSRSHASRMGVRIRLLCGIIIPTKAMQAGELQLQNARGILYITRVSVGLPSRLFWINSRRCLTYPMKRMRASLTVQKFDYNYKGGNNSPKRRGIYMPDGSVWRGQYDEWGKNVEQRQANCH